MASSDKNKSSPTINELNIAIANWTDGLSQIKTWQVTLHLPTKGGTVINEQMVATE